MEAGVWTRSRTIKHDYEQQGGLQLLRLLFRPRQSLPSIATDLFNQRRFLLSNMIHRDMFHRSCPGTPCSINLQCLCTFPALSSASQLKLICIQYLFRYYLSTHDQLINTVHPKRSYSCTAHHAVPITLPSPPVFFDHSIRHALR